MLEEELFCNTRNKQHQIKYYYLREHSGYRLIRWLIRRWRIGWFVCGWLHSIRTGVIYNLSKQKQNLHAYKQINISRWFICSGGICGLICWKVLRKKQR